LTSVRGRIDLAVEEESLIHARELGLCGLNSPLKALARRPQSSGLSWMLARSPRPERGAAFSTSRRDESACVTGCTQQPARAVRIRTTGGAPRGAARPTASARSTAPSRSAAVDHPRLGDERIHADPDACTYPP
jgi:hypothetical protein